MQFAELSTQYPVFIFKSFSWHFAETDFILEFHFQTGDHQFTPQITFHQVPENTKQWVITAEANSYFLNLGMVEAISYWKATCSPRFIIEAGTLTTSQLEWWQKLYRSGLGEFFYRNQIDVSRPDLLTFACRSNSLELTDRDIQLSTITPQELLENGDVLAAAAANTTIPSTDLEQPSVQPRTRFLVGVGGGKDSAVTLGLLDQLNHAQNNHFAYGALLMAPLSPAAEAVVAKSEAVRIHRLTRVIDPHLLELNAAGFLNGHTPFSAYFAFASALAARIYGYEQVVVSNENSANEGNLTWQGQTINHQYSKTFAFETNFCAYLDEWLGQYPVRPGYFSILRPWNELQIAAQFSHYPSFWPVFRSCNVGQKTNSWCHHCPKCVFVFILLSCFLEPTILVGQIFERNLYEDESLLPIFYQLIGFEANKPFECVGTKAEVLAALAHYCHQLKAAGKDLPSVLQQLTVAVGNAMDAAPSLDTLLQAWDTDHQLPPDLESVFKDTYFTTPTYV